MHRPLAALSFAVAAALLLPLGATGQAPPAREPEREVFGETIDVRAVNLEVVVEDRSGRRVSGLTPADFVLTVDGKPVSIDYFTEVAEGRAVKGGTDAASPAPPGVDGLEPGGEVGTSYLVFIDDSLTSIPHHRNIILRGVVDQVSRLRREDRMAVVGFGGRRPVLLSPWSQSPAELSRILAKSLARPVRGVDLHNEARGLEALAVLRPGTTEALPAVGRALRPSLPEANETLDEPTAGGCFGLLRLEKRYQAIVDGLTATMRSMADVPGRKIALVIAGGWPRIEKDLTCGNVGPAMWEPIHEVANQLGFTLYMTMSQAPPPAIHAEAKEPPDQILDNPQAKFSPLQETLFRLARQTGGRAWAGNPRRDVLDLVAADTRSYYWLGFTPTWKGDDETHEVKVQVVRPGMEVRSRRAFKDLSRGSEIDNKLENALLFGQMAGTFPLGVELGEVAPGGKDTVRVPLKVKIPLDLVTRVPRGDTFESDLELRVAVLDEYGRRNEVPAVPVKLTGKAPKPEEHATYEAELELRRGRHDVVVAILDRPSGRILQTRKAIEPEPKARNRKGR